MIQCEFLEKTFEVSKKKINALRAVEIESAIDYNESDTMDGLPQVEIKGYKPQGFSLEYTALPAAGLNPLKEYRAWKKKLGKAGTFYVGGDQFGADIFLLKAVNMTEGKVNTAGDFIAGKISITLEQDIAAKGD